MIKILRIPDKINTSGINNTQNVTLLTYICLGLPKPKNKIAIERNKKCKFVNRPIANKLEKGKNSKEKIAAIINTVLIMA